MSRAAFLHLFHKDGVHWFQPIPLPPWAKEQISISWVKAIKSTLNVKLIRLMNMRRRSFSPLKKKSGKFKPQITTSCPEVLHLRLFTASHSPQGWLWNVKNYKPYERGPGRAVNVFTVFSGEERMIMYERERKPCEVRHKIWRHVNQHYDSRTDCDAVLGHITPVLNRS